MTQHIVFVESSSSGAGERTFAYCRGQGHRTTLVTADPPGDPAADRVVVCDTLDAEAVAGTVARLHADDAVNGVTTTHDLYVPQAALAAERLGLASLGYQTAAGVRNKYRMRRALEEACPRLNPRFALVTTVPQGREEAERISYPLIAKPQDGFDSWGVERIDGPAALDAYLEPALALRTSPAGTPLAPGVLLEEFVDGPEHSVETAQSAGGQRRLLTVTSKEIVGEGDRHFAEIGITLPVPDETSAALYAEVGAGLDALGVRCGVIHTEIRVVDGQVKIMEVNPRLVGDMTGSHMIELALGASPIEQLVEIAVGKDPEWRPTRQRASASYGLCLPRTGEFIGLRNSDELLSRPGVADLRVTTRPGTSCHYPPRSNLDFVGRVVTAAESPELALDIAKKAAADAQVEVR